MRACHHRGAMAAPVDLHEWISFADPDEDRTWVVDVTFLLSRWTCIFGAGCQGVLTGPASGLVQGCCSYGAHFTDDDDVARVEAAARTLTAEQWQFRRRGRGPKGIVVRDDSTGETTTRMVDGACIFLNRPGFPGGAGCALHRAAMDRGVSHVELKPNVCWQLPLRREDTVGETGHVTSTVRQWDRRHWGEGGSEFHWWCTEAPEAFVGEDAVYRTMARELTELMSERAYEVLRAELDRRVRRRFQPHPAVADQGR